LGTFTLALIFPQASISNYIEQFFLCLQARLIDSSISTISSNKLEQNTVTLTKALARTFCLKQIKCFYSITTSLKC
jgi:hypothetical protein